MGDFHEVRFPLRLALATSGGPVRRTDIVRLTNGREHRNARWADARRRFDVGSAVRNIDDLYQVIAFFEARSGQLFGFRFRDPVDNSSTAPGAAISPSDQPIGTGDGSNRVFALSKTYGDAGGSTRRRIEKPVSASVVVAVSGDELPAGTFACDHATGIVTLDSAPPAGASVTAGFQFDVPVRFDIDRIDLNLTAFNAGQIPTIPLVEIVP